ncbi:STAS domain-containing protein [Amycolatopsis sp. cmx-4-54]|uniref:STAS domain-containing protein n=1 Tax=Amycolatopsis sp. cmx-4-54 TaxID=2790936 RepID=UPI00397963CB
MPSPHRHAAHVDPQHTAQAFLTTSSTDRLGCYSRPFTAGPARVLRHEHTADLLILSMSGELDTIAAPLLQRELTEDLPDCTVLDLSKVTFLGVAGLRALEAAAARARRERRRFALVTSSPTDLRILRIFALDVHVPVYPRLADAVREICSQRPPRDSKRFS